MGLNRFEKCVQEALENVKDADWLGAHSLLAASYFFEQKRPHHGRHAIRWRGEMLQKRLKKTLDQLLEDVQRDRDIILMQAREEKNLKKGESAWVYAHVLLDARYFHERFRPRTVEYIYTDDPLSGEPAYFAMSRATYHRHQDLAIVVFSRLFIQMHRPNLNLEQPPYQVDLAGRDTLRDQLLYHLRQGASVGLLGAPGVGKSVVGAAVVAQWESEAIFWLTVRPGINDTLQAFLFELANFLTIHNAYALWQHLLTNAHETIDLIPILSLLRTDLARLQSTSLLICLDSVDHLIALEQRPHFTAILGELKNAAPVLQIGAILLEDTVEIIIKGLTAVQCQQLVQGQQIDLDPDLLQSWYTLSSGNPRLLRLLVTLSKLGIVQDALLQAMMQGETAVNLFTRIWLQLPSQERTLLMQMSVYRRPIPIMMLQIEESLSTALGRLLQNALVIRHQNDTVEPAAYIIHALRDAATPEHRAALHQSAALKRSDMGQFTAACYHLIEAGDVESAVLLWHQHQAHEIEQGQAIAALNLFQNINPGVFATPATQEMWAVLCADLMRLNGDLERGRDVIEQIVWRPDTKLQFDAMVLNGDFTLEIDGMTEALEKYTQAEDIGIRIIAGLVGVYLKRGIAHERLSNLTQLRFEVEKAQCELERLQGMEEFGRGNLDRSERHLRVALTIAQQIKDKRLQGRLYLDLATVFSRSEQFEAAEKAWHDAIEAFTQYGDTYLANIAQLNLLFFYILAAKPNAAIELGERISSDFEYSANVFYRAVFFLNLGQAWLDSGRDDTKARDYAQRALLCEEDKISPNALLILGTVASRQQKWEQAKRYFDEAHQAVDGTEDRSIQAHVQQAYGELYLDQGDFLTAIKALEQALILFEAVGIETEIAKTKRLLAQARDSEC